MSRPLLLVLILGATLVAPGARAEDPTDAAAHPCVGQWVGVGRNSGDSDPWTIDMVVTSPAGERCGTIEYPSLRCGGHLERCEDKGGGRLSIMEHYTHNPGTCAPAGRLDVVCEGDTMQWRWFGIESVRTTLRRVRPADSGAPTPGGGSPLPPASPPGSPGDGPAPPIAPSRPAEPQGGGGLCSTAAPARASLTALGLFVAMAAAMAARRKRRRTE